MTPSGPNMSHTISWTRAWFAASVLAYCIGWGMAVLLYPTDYDWQYTVVSSLATKRDNPMGHFWYAGGFMVSMALLWPYLSGLKRHFGPGLSSLARFSFLALRVAIVFGVLMGLDWLFVTESERWFTKGHEYLALVTFIGFYAGILAGLVHAAMGHRGYWILTLAVAVPLLAIGTTQLWLYFEQRELGWVGVRWREMGIPLWLSFAFWQWLSVTWLYLALGLLSFAPMGPSGSRLPEPSITTSGIGKE